MNSIDCYQIHFSAESHLLPIDNRTFEDSLHPDLKVGVFMIIHSPEVAKGSIEDVFLVRTI